MDKISLAIEFLNQKFDESTYLTNHPQEKRYRYEHTLRVANIGKSIAKAEGFDIEAMAVACLLHDVSYCIEFKSDEEARAHGRMAANIARPFVKSLGFVKRTEDDILYGIAIHVDDKADFDGERTPFALCVSDADNIDRFDAYRIYEALKYTQYELLAYEDQLKFCTKRIERLRQLLAQPYATKTSTALFHEKLTFQIQFYEKLKLQLENSLDIK